MGNTKLISESKTKSLPHLPVLSVGKHRRVFSRHYTNLSLWLPLEELQLLSYLIYDSNTLADNTFVYNTELLKRFIAAFREANNQYLGVSTNKNLTQARRCLKNLIERGLILQTGTKNKLMINPLLTYSADVVNNKKHKEIQDLYQNINVTSASLLTNKFSNIVSEFLESKKKNYKYGRKAG